MNKNRISTGLCSVLLAAGISFAGMGCLVTAFDLIQIDLGQMLLVCLGIIHYRAREFK